ncbi:hypothetical protein HK098_007630 [Nowakowskiella sp. JEL0407]|nr:hypothetical protein HK098_007630 [Nowakowskiella sp. JEL0407]
MCIQTPTAIYMNGFGANGKLGFENEETVFTPKRVPSLSHPASQSSFGALGSDTAESSDADKVVKVALGQNHTLILYKSGCIKSFGSNKFGQLGYESDNKSDSKFIPATVSGPLKKLHVVDIAASKFHSVAVTDKNFLYTWGCSTGQLGYVLAKDTPQYTPRKVGLKLPSSSSCVVGVSCTNFATAVVVETPVESTSNFLAVQAGRYTMLLVFVRDEEVKVNIKNIVSVTAGSGYFAVVVEDGDVCLVDVECVEKDWKKRVKKVWSGKRREGRAVGCTVGTKVLVLTQDGDVYEIDL